MLLKTNNLYYVTNNKSKAKQTELIGSQETLYEKTISGKQQQEKNDIVLSRLCLGSKYTNLRNNT